MDAPAVGTLILRDGGCVGQQENSVAGPFDSRRLRLLLAFFRCAMAGWRDASEQRRDVPESTHVGENVSATLTPVSMKSGRPQNGDRPMLCRIIWPPRYIEGE
jgi:hypothetical protein